MRFWETSQQLFFLNDAFYFYPDSHVKLPVSYKLLHDCVNLIVIISQTWVSNVAMYETK